LKEAPIGRSICVNDRLGALRRPKHPLVFQSIQRGKIRVSFCMANYSVEVLRGPGAVAGVTAEIGELCERSGLADNPLLRLDFFLRRVRLFPGNRPVVLLVRPPERLEGAVYLFEKTLCALPTVPRGGAILSEPSPLTRQPSTLLGFPSFASATIAARPKRVSLPERCPTR
jgi:hypothetical protein